MTQPLLSLIKQVVYWFFFYFRDPDYDNINNIYSRLPSKAPSPSPRAQKAVHLTCECHKQGQTTPGKGKQKLKGDTDSSEEDSDGEEEGNRPCQSVNQSINCIVKTINQSTINQSSIDCVSKMILFQNISGWFIFCGFISFI